MTQELHTRYYEPLARIAPSLEDILQGPPVKKLLFMTDPAVINSDLKPQWQARRLPFHFFSGTLQLSQMRIPSRDVKLTCMCSRVVYLSTS